MGSRIALESAEVGYFAKCQLIIVYFIQKVFDWVDDHARPWVIEYFERSNISCYYVANTDFSSSNIADNRQALFEEILKTLQNAQSISISLGAMGHHLMENPSLVAGLQAAIERNGARIQIVHGPNVDPKTQSVFLLAEQGAVTLYRTPHYDRHHFMIIEQLDGSWSVLDEQCHNETLWYTDRTGNPVELFQSSGRFYYLIRRSAGRARGLLRKFEKRKRIATQIDTHPGIERSQTRASLQSLVEFFFTIPLKMLLQPLAVYWDAAFDTRVGQPSDIERHTFVENQPQHIYKELPPAAQQWMDEQMATLHSAPASTDRQNWAATSSASSNVHGYSLKAFRDLQFVHKPNASIAGLSISDELFLDLIWNELYTVGDLEKKLSSAGPMTLTYSSSSNRLSSHSRKNEAEKYGEIVELLLNAIDQWHSDSQPAISRFEPSTV